MSKRQTFRLPFSCSSRVLEEFIDIIIANRYNLNIALLHLQMMGQKEKSICVS